MTKIFSHKFPRYSVVVFCVLSLVAAGLTVDTFRISVAEVRLAIIPKDVRSATLADQIVSTAAVLPRTTDFYDALLKQNADIQDPWKGLSTEERRVAWNRYVKTHREDKSGIVSLTISGNNQIEAAALIQKTEAELSYQVNRLYGGPGQDILVRPIDKMAFRTEISSPFLWGILSLAAGFVVTALIFLLGSGVRRMFVRSHKDESLVIRPHLFFGEDSIRAYQTSYRSLHIPNGADTTAAATTHQFPFTPSTAPVSEKTLPSTETMAPKETIAEPIAKSEPIHTEQSAVSQPKLQPVFSPSVPLEQKHVAPSNLPFVEGEFSWEAQLPGLIAKPNESAAETSLESPVIEAATPEATEEQPGREPTPEELKARLNQLLQGKM